MRMNFEKYGIEVPYRRTSGNVKVHCPECRDRRHDKRDRSLSVNLATGMFKCHYCGFQGCAAEQDEQEKQKWMEQQSWYRPVPIKKQKPEYKKPTQTGSSQMSQKALAWFAGRGISEKTLREMKVTEGQEWMPQKNGKANTVQFNYYKDGVLVNTKFRTGDKCFKLCSGAELLPYNIDAIKGTKECIITEGEMDALSFWEIGRHDVVSVPNGANANLSYLDDYIETYFDDKETIYIASDTDTRVRCCETSSCAGSERKDAGCWSTEKDARTQTSTSRSTESSPFWNACRTHQKRSWKESSRCRTLNRALMPYSNTGCSRE